MARRLTGVDIALIVCGSLLLCFCVALFGLAGAIINTNEKYEFEYVSNGACYIVLGIAAWYGLTAAIAIGAGSSRHQCPYIAVIVLSILGIFISVGAGIVVLRVVYYGLWDANHDIPIPDILTTPAIFHVDTDRDAAIAALHDLGIGVMIVNFLTFILLIVISSLGCCGTCCLQRINPAAPPLIVSAPAGGYVAAPPGFVSQPPAIQQYQFEGIANPNCDDTSGPKSS